MKTNRHKSATERLVLTSVCIAAGMACGEVRAQAAAAPSPAASAASAPRAAATSSGDLGTITVTARRRNEALVDVPIAISVVTSDKIQQLGIKSTTDLANYTPGLEFNNFTPVNARNDRGAGRILTFRGLILTGGNAASMFLDGAAVVGNEIPASLDIGAVEVLRGPQSVYFGRATMTGAVSYRTKPIPDHWTGQAEFEVGQRNTHNEQATIAGPILPGKLGGRLTLLSESQGGYVANDYNNDAQKLGATSRKSISGTLDFTPIDSVDIKGYYNQFRDDDGPAATAFIPTSLQNCQLPGATQKTFCGEIPDRTHSINYQNTTLPANFANALVTNNALIQGAGFDAKVGQQRIAQNSDVVASWDINDYLKFQSITGYHTQKSMALADGISQPVGTATGTPRFPNSGYWYSYNLTYTDFSQELRLSSDPERDLSWTFGSNFISNHTYRQPITATQSQAGVFTATPQTLTDDLTMTTGVFGGIYYKLTPKWNLSGEAREQQDKRRGTSDAPTGAHLFDLSHTFRSFSPRVAIDYAVADAQKVYASYATGTRPGGFNTQVASYITNSAATAQINSLVGSGITYQEEKLKIGELGYKGELPGRKGYFDVNAYYGVLTNQQVQTTAFIPALNFSVTGFNNAGKSKIHGIEFQGTYNVTERFSVSPTFAWNYTKRSSFVNTSGLAAFGTTDFGGKKFANVPEFSGSVVAAYSQPLVDRWSIYGNVAETYRGKTYADAFDASYMPSRFQTDLRVGVNNDQFTIEGYVKNVFNDQKYTGGAVSGDFGSQTLNTLGNPVNSNAFFGGWAPPRQVGARLIVKF